MDYLKDPAAIYARSFETIRAEADFSHLPASAHAIATRVIHACGMVEAAAELVISGEFQEATHKALSAGATILTDAEMVRHGIIARQLPWKNEIICTLNDEAVPAMASAMKTTRSAAAVHLWRDHLDGSVVVIGNAPTALFALLELIDSGAPKPASIVGFPVGFVGAAESKDELIANPRNIPFAAIKGRKGGSAMAAAVVNAVTGGAA